MKPNKSTMLEAVAGSVDCHPREAAPVLGVEAEDVPQSKSRFAGFLGHEFECLKVACLRLWSN